MKRSALLVTIAPIPAFLFIAYAFAPAIWSAGQIAGGAIMLTSLAVLTIARVQLGNSFSVTAQATHLVTRGIYARIRNPIYVFSTLVFAGLFLYVDRPLLLLALIPIGFIQFVRAGREAKVLEQRFGDAYREYRARTWF
jgi:protein-S-isoprenylcysteine O-methyltransferase Ste14